MPAGDGNTSDSQRVAIERVKEKMKEEAQKLEEMHSSQRNHLEDVRPRSHADFSYLARMSPALHGFSSGFRGHQLGSL